MGDLLGGHIVLLGKLIEAAQFQTRAYRRSRFVVIGFVGLFVVEDLAGAMCGQR